MTAVGDRGAVQDHRKRTAGYIGRLTINFDDIHLILDIFSTKSMGQPISATSMSDSVVSDRRY
jgi:hypothetical protein